MDSALDTLSGVDYLSQLQDAQPQQGSALTANPNDYGALPAPKEKIDPSDVEMRKQIFNNASQRILAMRNAMQRPYNGANLGQLAFGAELMKPEAAPGMAYGNAALAQAQAQETQRQADAGYLGQQQQMDTRSAIAKILSSPTLGEEDKLQNIYQLSIVGGDDKAASSAASMMRAMHTGVSGRVVSVLNEQGKPEMVSAADAVARHLAPIVRDPTTGAILNQTGTTGQQQPIPPKVQQVWQDDNLGNAPTHVSKDEAKDNEAEYKKMVDAHDSALGAAKVADQAKEALKNYWSGPAGQTMADWNASLPDFAQSKAAQNTQFINKKSGELAMQIANSSKGMRIGVGMERFAKSTTIDTKNSKDTNMRIVENLQEMPYLTQQQKDMEAYVKQFPVQHKEAIKDAFYQDYPMMLDQGEDKPAILNPAYKDPSLFKKWLQNQSSGAGGPPPGGADAGGQPPQGAKQASDGNYYLPDPKRPGKYLQWQP